MSTKLHVLRYGSNRDAITGARIVFEEYWICQECKIKVKESSNYCYKCGGEFVETEEWELM